MKTTELIKELREGNDCLLNKAADKLEELQRYIDDMRNDHYVDCLDFYADRSHELEEDLAVALNDMRRILMTTDADICEYCKHNHRCMKEKCDKYISIVGDVECKWPTWEWTTCEWTCMDFIYGTCPKLKNTPCNGCFERDYAEFEWRGKIF